MKILMFTGALPRVPSGVGDYVGELQRALGRRLEFSILTTDSPEVDPMLAPGVKIHSVVKNWGLSDLPAIHAIIREERPDAFHQQYPSSMGGSSNRAILSNILPLWLKARFPNTPLITTFHEFGERRLRWRARAIPNLVLSDAVITITERDRKILSRWKSKVARIPIMSNIPAAAVGTPAAQPPGPEGSSGKKAKVVYFGFLKPLKGFERFVDVAALLGGDDYDFSVIGEFAPESDPYHRSLLKRIRHAGLEGAFRFKGRMEREAVAEELATSRCCLLPYEEGVSERRGSFLAAITQDIPVVTTVGPFTPKEYLDVQGLAILPKTDLWSMGEKVKEFCARRPDPAGLAAIRKSVEIEVIAEAHMSLYSDLVAS